MSERKSNGWIRLRGKIWWITIRKDDKSTPPRREVFSAAHTMTARARPLPRPCCAASRRRESRRTTHRSRWKNRRNTLRESYLNRNPEQRLRSAVARMRHLDDFFDGMTAAEVNNIDNIFKFQNQLRSQKRLSDPTIRRISVLLRAILNRAKKDGKLQQYSVVDVPMPKDSKPRQGFTTAETFWRFRLLPESCRAGDLSISHRMPYGCRAGDHMEHGEQEL